MRTAELCVARGSTVVYGHLCHPAVVQYPRQRRELWYTGE